MLWKKSKAFLQSMKRLFSIICQLSFCIVVWSCQNAGWHHLVFQKCFHLVSKILENWDFLSSYQVISTLCLCRAGFRTEVPTLTCTEEFSKCQSLHACCVIFTNCFQSLWCSNATIMRKVWNLFDRRRQAEDLLWLLKANSCWLAKAEQEF